MENARGMELVCVFGDDKYPILEISKKSIVIEICSDELTLNTEVDFFGVNVENYSLLDKRVVNILQNANYWVQWYK